MRHTSRRSVQWWAWQLRFPEWAVRPVCRMVLPLSAAPWACSKPLVEAGWRFWSASASAGAVAVGLAVADAVEVAEGVSVTVSVGVVVSVSVDVPVADGEGVMDVVGEGVSVTVADSVAGGWSGVGVGPRSKGVGSSVIGASTRPVYANSSFTVRSSADRLPTPIASAARTRPKKVTAKTTGIRASPSTIVPHGNPLRRRVIRYCGGREAREAIGGLYQGGARLALERKASAVRLPVGVQHGANSGHIPLRLNGLCRTSGPGESLILARSRMHVRTGWASARSDKERLAGHV
jgi:hypothetical protein